jgi:hypothetical protein
MPGYSEEQPGRSDLSSVPLEPALVLCWSTANGILNKANPGLFQAHNEMLRELVWNGGR